MRHRGILSCGEKIFFLLPILMLFLSACGGEQDHQMDIRVDSTNTRSKDLYTLAQEIGDLSQFVDAIDQTAMKERLSTEGPFTVFAPSNRAFSQSFGIDSILGSSNQDSLREILEQHIMRGLLYSGQVEDSERVSTLSMRSLLLERQKEGGSLLVEGKPVRTSIPAQNGILYILDSLIVVPPPDTTNQEEGEQAVDQ